MQIVTQTEQAYWELAYAYGNLEVQLDAVRIGREQDESNRRQQQQGLLAPIDVVAAQRQLATFELNAYSAQEALTAAENTLKTLILPDRSDPTWSSALIPVTPRERIAAGHALAGCGERSAGQPARAGPGADLGRDQRKRQPVLPRTDQASSGSGRQHTNAGLAGIQLPARPNPFTAGLAGLTRSLNDLSVLAGLPPLPSTGGGTTTGLPPAAGGRLRPIAQQPIGRQFSDHAGAVAAFRCRSATAPRRPT